MPVDTNNETQTKTTPTPKLTLDFDHIFIGFDIRQMDYPAEFVKVQKDVVTTILSASKQKKNTTPAPLNQKETFNYIFDLLADLYKNADKKKAQPTVEQLLDLVCSEILNTKTRLGNTRKIIVDATFIQFSAALTAGYNHQVGKAKLTSSGHINYQGPWHQHDKVDLIKSPMRELLWLINWFLCRPEIHERLFIYSLPFCRFQNSTTEYPSFMALVQACNELSRKENLSLYDQYSFKWTSTPKESDYAFIQFIKSSFTEYRPNGFIADYPPNYPFSPDNTARFFYLENYSPQDQLLHRDPWVSDPKSPNPEWMKRLLSQPELLKAQNLEQEEEKNESDDNLKLVDYLQLFSDKKLAYASILININPNFFDGKYKSLKAIFMRREVDMKVKFAKQSGLPLEPLQKFLLDFHDEQDDPANSLHDIFHLVRQAMRLGIPRFIVIDTGFGNYVTGAINSLLQLPINLPEIPQMKIPKNVAKLLVDKQGEIQYSPDNKAYPAFRDNPFYRHLWISSICLTYRKFRELLLYIETGEPLLSEQKNLLEDLNKTWQRPGLLGTQKMLLDSKSPGNAFEIPLDKINSLMQIKLNAHMAFSFYAKQLNQNKFKENLLLTIDWNLYPSDDLKTDTLKFGLDCIKKLSSSYQGDMQLMKKYKPATISALLEKAGEIIKTNVAHTRLFWVFNHISVLNERGESCTLFLDMSFLSPRQAITMALNTPKETTLRYSEENNCYLLGDYNILGTLLWMAGHALLYPWRGNFVSLLGFAVDPKKNKEIAAMNQFCQQAADFEGLDKDTLRTQVGLQHLPKEGAYSLSEQLEDWRPVPRDENHKLSEQPFNNWFLEMKKDYITNFDLNEPEVTSEMDDGNTSE